MCSTFFGTTFGVGIRNRAPNKDDAPHSMHHGDVVNFVDVSYNRELTDDERRQVHTFAQSINFIYFDTNRILQIRV
jgi:hypothetical protein